MAFCVFTFVAQQSSISLLYSQSKQRQAAIDKYSEGIDLAPMDSLQRELSAVALKACQYVLLDLSLSELNSSIMTFCRTTAFAAIERFATVQ